MTHYHLAIIGSGSGNSLVTEDFEDKNVAIIERGTFGGTCLNVGCIPTKMFVYAADVATTIRHAATYGVDATLDGVRWRDIRERVFSRIDPISDAGRDHRVNGPNTTAYLGSARFIGPKTLEVDVDGRTSEVTADQIVIAAGSRAIVPEQVAASGVPFHTSDTIMRIDELPRRLVILGGGYIAAEFAHVFSSLGVEVTLVVRGPRIFRHLDAEVGERFTEVVSSQWDVRLSASVTGARETEDGVTLDLGDGTTAVGDLLLVATGRTPNSDGLGLAAAGIATHPNGRIAVDSAGRTNVAGVWALGDVSSPYQLKHVANHEARVVAHNLVHPEALQEFDHRYVPYAVFTSPQIASVGLTEEQARDRGYDVTTKVQAYGDTAYGWAMEDTTGFCKLVADRTTGELLGAHLMGHQASNLIQPLIQGMSLGTGVREMARGQYWIHPALMEVVENALLGLGVVPAEDLSEPLPV